MATEKKITIELSDKQASALLGYLDIAVKQVGLRGAGMALYIAQEIEKASLSAKPESGEKDSTPEKEISGE